jgi:hypothetical protein
MQDELPPPKTDPEYDVMRAVEGVILKQPDQTRQCVRVHLTTDLLLHPTGPADEDKGIRQGVGKIHWDRTTVGPP